MFTVVTLNTSRSIFTKSIKLTSVTNCGVQYYLLQLKHRRRINWKRVEKILGDTKTRAVFSDEFLLPTNFSNCPIDDNAYSNISTMKALDEILNINKNVICKKDVVLIDIFCKHQAYARLLVKYFGTIHIITSKIELYQAFRNNMLYDMGATVMLSDSIKHISENIALVVSPDGIMFPCMNNIKRSIPIITVKPIDAVMVNVNIINSFELNLPLHLKSCLPDGINANYFMAAVYEYCGIRDLSDRFVTHCICKGERILFKNVKENLFNSNDVHCKIV